MRAKDYATAYRTLLSEKKLDEQTLVKNFITTVIRNGHKALLPKILRAIAKQESRAVKQQTVIVSSAHAIDEKHVADLLKQSPYKELLTAEHKKVIRDVDPNLIGGYKIRTRSKQVDTTHKRKLLDLYQHITQ